LLLENDALRRQFVETVASFESYALKAAINHYMRLGSDVNSGATSLSTTTPATSPNSATR
jgi:hypothetical protein